MHKHTELTEKRILTSLPLIESLIYPATAPVQVEAWHVGGEPVSLQTALAATYEPFAVGDPWGPTWDTTWFRLTGSVPEDWAGREVVVLMRISDQGWEGFTAEGLIYRDGKIVRALNVNRKEIEVAEQARGGEAFEFYVEAAANVSNDKLSVAQKSKPVFKLEQAELALVNREAWAYYLDFKLLSEMMFALPAANQLSVQMPSAGFATGPNTAALPGGSQRRAEILYALNESINCLDTEDPATIAAAREALAGVLARKNGDTVHSLSAIGHAHIDTAWLWPLRETIRKCARTFSSALDYMGRYPEYIFGCSQAQQYAWMKALYPEIFEGIKKQVARGQWEPIGSMWVEVDCNLASGESLVRQILHGKRFFKEELGYETKDVWIPDVFGYSAALPQIFAECGVDFFVTQKISWSQFNKFPHQTFLWEGIDGTRIFTHFPPADTYNAEMKARELIQNVNNFKEHGRATRSLYVYGFGDGGGGPTPQMIETARRVKDLEGLPKVQLEKVIDFARKVKEDARDLPVWIGELYLEFHRGTYTSQARNKRGNRKAEFLLRDAEFLDALSWALAPNRTETAADPARAVYDVTGLGEPGANLHARALDRAWKLVLLNQFHDIIPGSSIAWVYKDSTRDYQAVTELGESVIASSRAALALDTTGFTAPVAATNTLNFERHEVVEIAPGKLTRIDVPACGYAVVESAEPLTQKTAGIAPVQVSQKGGAVVVENGLIRLTIGADGVIESLWDMEAGREALAQTDGKGSGNLLQIHPDVPHNYDAWDVDIFYKERVRDIRELDELAVVETHPLRAQVRVKRSFGKSTLTQNIVIRAGSRRVDFVTEADWHEKQKMLKAAFPVDIRAVNATYEIQYGHLERPTHYNTSWDLARFEVCAQKWADLSEPGYGVALLNDCKYGHDIFGNTLRLSLLRAPIAPDNTADHGHHRFTYAILPHAGDLRQAGVIEEAYALNVPLRLDPLPVQTGALPARQSFFETDRPGVIIESVKRAEAGDAVIVRLYEAHGSRGPVRLSTTLPVKTVERTNMLETTAEPLAIENNAVSLSLHPFEIVTLKLRME